MGMSILAPFAQAQAEVNLRLTVGASSQSKNVIQNPNTDTGTRFSLSDAIGEDPTIASRLEVNWDFKERHNLRIILAPLLITETVTFENSIQFAGESFNANQPLEAAYKFNSWRVGYHYTAIDNKRNTLQIGGTLKLRDAKIRLTQDNITSLDGGLGLVPLLYLAGKYRLNDKWTIGADVDGLVVSRGRAIDLGLTIDFAITDRWRIGADWRVLDGGVDSENAYNFVQFNTTAISVSAIF